jgi:hypothetical protein
VIGVRTASRRAVIALAALSLVSACGGNGTTSTTATTTAPTTESVTAAIVSALLPDPTGGEPFDTSSATCVAHGMIDGIGFDRVAELTNAAASGGGGDPTAIFGVMTPDEVAQAMTAVEACVDLQGAVVDTMAFFGFPSDVASCVGGALVAADFGQPILQAFLTGSDPTTDADFAAAYIGALSQTCPDSTHAMVVQDLTSNGISDADATCVADAFRQADNFSAIITVWTGLTDPAVDTTAVNNQIIDVFGSCLTADELATLGVDMSGTSTTSTP